MKSFLTFLREASGSAVLTALASLPQAHLLPERGGSFVLPNGTVALLPSLSSGGEHDRVLDRLGHTLADALTAGAIRHRVDAIMCGAKMTDAQASVIADSANAFLLMLFVSIQRSVYGTESTTAYTTFTTPVKADALRRWVNSHV